MNIQKSIVAFLGLAFVLYWIVTTELPDTRQTSLDPVTPNIVRLPIQIPVPQFAAQALAHLPPRTHEHKSDLLDWLKGESAKIGQIDPNPAQTMQKLRQKAAGLNKNDFLLLKQIALNSQTNGDERFLAVYILSLSNSESVIAELKDVGLAKIPATVSDRQHSEEIILRTQALEALLQRLTGREAKTLLHDLLGQTSDPILARHVQYWLSRLG